MLVCSAAKCGIFGSIRTIELITSLILRRYPNSWIPDACRSRGPQVPALMMRTSLPNQPEVQELGSLQNGSNRFVNDGVVAVNENPRSKKIQAAPTAKCKLGEPIRIYSGTTVFGSIARWLYVDVFCNGRRQ